MASDPALELRLSGNGWADLIVLAGDSRHEIRGISYLSSVLDDLIRLALDIATDRGFGFARFFHEPGATVLFAECSWWEEGTWVPGHRISAIDWSDIDDREPTWSELREAPRLFIVELESRDAIAAAILATAEQVLATHGADGYSKLWTGRLGFPARGLEALRAALAVPAVEVEAWNG